MLSISDVFALYAELALALAGFAGVVSAFSGRDRAFRPTEALRVLGVILNSAAVVFGSLTFYSLLGAGQPEELAIRGSGLTSLVVTIWIWVLIIPRAWQQANDPESTTGRGVMYVIMSILAVVVSLYGATTLASFGVAPLLIGFPIQLALALWLFSRLLMRPN